MRVALFATCLVDALYPDVGIATVRLLERLGCTVEFPLGQTCCGQAHVNTGYRRDAARLVAHHAEVFQGFDAIVAPSASCVGCVRHQHAAVASAYGDRSTADAIAAISARTWELSEFLVDHLKVIDVGAYFPYRVALHPTCHSLRALHVGDRPRRLLGAVRGLTLVELANAEECCGFGGTFAVKNSDVSVAMMTDKIAHIIDSGADYVTAGDSSCLMHIGGGLSRRRSRVRPTHLAQILAGTEKDHE